MPEEQTISAIKHRGRAQNYDPSQMKESDEQADDRREEEALEAPQDEQKPGILWRVGSGLWGATSVIQ